MRRLKIIRERGNRLYLVAFLLWRLSWAGSPETLPIYHVKELATHPHPGRGFTQGFLFKDHFFFESVGLYGRSKILKYPVGAKTVSLKKKIEHYFAEGLAWSGKRFFQLTWKSGIVFAYDETLTLKKKYTISGEGWGLTYGRRYLWMSDGSSTLKKVTPKGFNLKSQVVVKALSLPVKYLNELEWIKGKIWSNIWMKPYIVIIDPQSGIVEALVDLSEIAKNESKDVNAVLNGIAYDARGNKIWITGKHWHHIYEINCFPSGRWADRHFLQQAVLSRK